MVAPRVGLTVASRFRLTVASRVELMVASRVGLTVDACFKDGTNGGLKGRTNGCSRLGLTMAWD